MRRPIDQQSGRAPLADTQKRADIPSARPFYQQVFWDWNGTLLDDRDYAIGVRNRVFPRFGLPTIDCLEEYYRQFTFPVRVYYERAGVTQENFTDVANAWMDEYMRCCDQIPLHGDALPVLRAFQGAGLRQVILSASQVDILEKQLSHYGVRDYFADVLGLTHIYATSKAAMGREYLERQGLPREACVLLGDSLHDAQVAEEMGIACILVSQGHQSKETLRTAGVPVCDCLAEAARLVLGAGSGNEIDSTERQ